MGQSMYTPGPWAVHPIFARVDCQKLSNKGGLLPVCELLWPTDERSEAETEANARLIAAAPDLLEVAEQALSFLAPIAGGDPEGAELIDALSAAITKARSEGK